MSLSCFKNCRKGDIVYLKHSSEKYLVSHDYIPTTKPGWINLIGGYTPLVIVSSGQETFISEGSEKFIVKIIKAIK